MPGRYLVTLIVPLTIIAVAIPLILEKVPRNGFYGFRTSFTMSSDEIWYRANKISGVALLAGGVFWLLLGQILPNVMDSSQSAYRLVGLFGASSLIGGCAVTYWLTYKK
jgi:hypothetical protein